MFLTGALCVTVCIVNVLDQNVSNAADSFSVTGYPGTVHGAPI